MQNAMPTAGRMYEMKKSMVEILKERNYRLDEENKRFSVTPSYDTAEELVDTHISTPDRIVFLEEDSDMLMYYLQDIPKGYQCDLDLRIKDFEGYQPKAFLDALQNSIDMWLNRFESEKKKQHRLFYALLISGIIFLIIMALAEGHILFKNETADSIVSEILDIGGWVFIWEAFTVRFLTPSETFRKWQTLRKKLHRISLSDAEGHTLEALSRSDLFDHELG